MSTTAISNAVAEYAEWFVTNEVKHLEANQPERLAKLLEDNPRAIEDFRAGWISKGETLANGILNKSPEFLKRVLSGLLHPDNKATRKLFTAVTGIELPKTSGATYQVVQKYCGVELTNLINAEQQARKEAEAEKLRIETQEQHARMDQLAEKIKADKDVTGSEVVELARYLGIDVHPRTAGTFYKRVKVINTNKARVTGKGGLPDGAWDVFRQVRKRLVHDVREFIEDLEEFETGAPEKLDYMGIGTQIHASLSQGEISRQLFGK